MLNSNNTISFSGKSYNLNCIFYGKLTNDYNIPNMIIVVDKPNLLNLKKLTLAKCLIFTDYVSETSHIFLFLKDLCIPIINGIDHEINKYLNKKVTFFAKDLSGTVFIGKQYYEFNNCNLINKKYIFASSFKSLNYYKNHNCEIVILRGEFLLLSILIENNYNFIDDLEKITQKIFKVLQFASQNYKNIIYRFIDISEPDIFNMFQFKDLKNTMEFPVKNERGAYGSLYTYNTLLLIELDVVSRLKNKPQLLIPYLRSINEGKKIISLINDKISENIKIGCMIEVPSMIFIGRELSEIFDFFGIGTKDLFQLFSGYNRNSTEFNNKDYHLLIKLLNNFFIPDIDKNKAIYIPNKAVHDEIKKIYKFHNVLYLKD